MFSIPPSSLVKAMALPSGENLGWWSYAGPRLIAVAAPPPTGRV
jgi:hypothetical protein